MDDRVVSIRPGVEPEHDFERLMRETAISAISSAAATAGLVGMALVIVRDDNASTVQLLTPDDQPVTNSMVAALAASALLIRASGGNSFQTETP